MSNRAEQQEPHDGEEQLQDTFIASFVIGLFILAVWLWIFFVYLDRI